MNAFGYLHASVNRQNQRGLSLIELMISITIGLLILSAMATLFVNQSKTRTELDKSNRMIDNGRYALEVLSENLRVAGFYGERDIAPAGAINDPCTSTPATPALAELVAALGLHVAGYNAATATADIMGTLPCGLTATQLKTGSDILVLRRVSTATPIAAANATVAPNGNSTVYLQVSNCSTDTSGSYQVAIGSAAFTAFQNKDCATPASLRPFIVQVYFVSPYNNAGDGIPTLKRRELDAATGAFVTTPLVEGIEYLQIDYGLDADADGAADSYVEDCLLDAACWQAVVSVKLNIIARNIEPTAGHNDTKTYFEDETWEYTPSGSDRNYKRHAYTQVVRLVNPSGRRETP